MRKLKLQVQMSVDGFVAGPEGQLDWMTFAMDEKLLAFINQLTDTSDTILLGRKMTEGFITYWEHVAPNSPEYDFAQKMVGMPKVVFSRTAKQIAGKNVRVENGPLVDAVNRLKGQAGKDIVVYGGASFVSSLIENRLIDYSRVTLPNVGGVTEYMKIAALCETHHVQLALHNSIGALCTPASTQFNTALPNVSVQEQSQRATPPLGAFTSTIQAEPGRLTATDAPGLGITADLSQALPPDTAVIPRLHRPDGSVTNW